MSIISIKNTQCYQVVKKPCEYLLDFKSGDLSSFKSHYLDRYYLSNNNGDLSKPIKDWKNMRCLYDYLLKEHKLYDRNTIKKIVKTENKSNGVFLLDNDEDDEEIE